MVGAWKHRQLGKKQSVLNFLISQRGWRERRLPETRKPADGDGQTRAWLRATSYTLSTLDSSESSAAVSFRAIGHTLRIPRPTHAKSNSRRIASRYSRDEDLLRGVDVNVGGIRPLSRLEYLTDLAGNCIQELLKLKWLVQCFMGTQHLGYGTVIHILTSA